MGDVLRCRSCGCTQPPNRPDLCPGAPLGFNDTGGRCICHGGSRAEESCIDLAALPDPAPIGGMLLLRVDEPHDVIDNMVSAILDHYRGRGPHPLIVVLPPGSSLETLDEEQMAAAGWVRRG